MWHCMRTSVILTSVGVSALILAPSLYFHQSFPLTPSAPALAMDETKAVSPPRPRLIAVRPRDHLPVGQEDPSRASAPDHAGYVVERAAELGDMATTRDPAALNTILSELNNPDPEIRKVALVATVDFGSQDAIPALQNEIDWTSDPQEKIDLQKAINFLQLPPAIPNSSP